MRRLGEPTDLLLLATVCSGRSTSRSRSTCSRTASSRSRTRRSAYGARRARRRAARARAASARSRVHGRARPGAASRSRRVFLSALNQICFVYAIKLTTATTVSLILGTTPIFAAAVASAARARAAQRRASGSRPRSRSPASRSSRSARAAASRATRRRPARRSALAATWAAYSVCRRAADAALLAVPDQRARARCSMTALAAPDRVAPAREPRTTGPVARSIWLALAFAVVGPLVLTNVLWFTAISRVGPSRATLFANLQPFLAASSRVLLLSEPLERAPGRRRRPDRARHPASPASPSREPVPAARVTVGEVGRR